MQNLIKLDNIDKEKLKSLEKAANSNQLDKEKIFKIYSNVSFDLNNLIKAENIYQTLDSVDARALIYQKYLLSDNEENKIKLLFTLKDLFQKDDLSNVYTEFLSNRLKEIDTDSLSKSYKEVVKNNIVTVEEIKLGKIKYNDKILHQSRLLKYFKKEIDQKKLRKILLKYLKRLKKIENISFLQRMLL